MSNLVLKCKSNTWGKAAALNLSKNLPRISEAYKDNTNLLYQLQLCYLTIFFSWEKAGYNMFNSVFAHFSFVLCFSLLRRAPMKNMDGYVLPYFEQLGTWEYWSCWETLYERKI